MKFILKESKLNNYIENHIRKLDLEFFCDVTVEKIHDSIEVVVKVDKRKIRRRYDFNLESIRMEEDFIKYKVRKSLEPFKGIPFYIKVDMGLCDDN